MSANSGNNSGQEVDLNITPIIDCFTVLITFLLASASFLSIGFFEVYTPGTTANAETIEPDVEIVLKVGTSNSDFSSQCHHPSCWCTFKIHQ